MFLFGDLHLDDEPLFFGSDTMDVKKCFPGFVSFAQMLGR
jgi:hypothetical protein